MSGYRGRLSALFARFFPFIPIYQHAGEPLATIVLGVPVPWPARSASSPTPQCGDAGHDQLLEAVEGDDGRSPSGAGEWLAAGLKLPSDWKNDYLDICRSCSVRDACGGVFTTSGNRLSQHLRPVP
jgi:hypothetical protein